MTGRFEPQTPEPGLGASRPGPDGAPEGHIASSRRLRVCVVGSGTRFLSGISYYTDRLAAALAEQHEVSVILMRSLLPARFYPGRERVGRELARFSYGGSETYDGVDWTLLPSIIGAWRALRRWRPDVIVFQWWTGTVLHSYILLARMARALGAKVIVEFHEVLDTGEDRIPLAKAYVRALSGGLMRSVDGYVVHNQADIANVERRFSLATAVHSVIPHGPYDRFDAGPDGPGRASGGDAPITLLYFGVLREYKGVDVLLRAFDRLEESEARRYRLLIVGETWEDYDVPTTLVRESRHRERIEFVNRYVHDDEVGAFFEKADAVVLPYRRSSASGPLSIAMSFGLPVVVSDVGGIPEAVDGYEGAVLVPPGDETALLEALRGLQTIRGQRFRLSYTWGDAVERFDELFRAVDAREP